MSKWVDYFMGKVVPTGLTKEAKDVCPWFPLNRGMVVIYASSQNYINSERSVKLRSWLLVMEVYEETGMVSGIELSIDRDDVSGKYFLKLGKSRNVRRDELEAAYRYREGVPSGDALETLLKHHPEAADSWTLVYQRNADGPLEITVEELEKQFGRKVKIVGKEN